MPNMVLQCERTTRCVCETQMPSIMANSKDGHGHNYKYLDTSRKILLQEMLMCNITALSLTVQKLSAMLNFPHKKNGSKLQSQGHRVKNNGTHGKILSHRILM